MRYFEIIDALESQKRWYLSDPMRGEDEYLIPNDFLKGERFPHEGEINAPIFKRGPKKSFNFTTLGVPLVTGDVKECLSQIAGELLIQWIPIRIQTELGSYYIFNVLNCISCLSPESKIDCWPEDGSDKAGKMLVVREVVLASGRPYPAVFRVAEWNHGIFVDENVMLSLQEINASGIQFRNARIAASTKVYLPR